VVKFSHGGHLFAAVNKNVIQVYSTYALHGQAQVLKGHAGPVTSLCWSSNDQRLASCSAAGELFEWRVDTMTRDHARDSILRTCRWAHPSYSLKIIVDRFRRWQRFADSRLTNRPSSLSRSSAVASAVCSPGASGVCCSCSKDCCFYAASRASKAPAPIRTAFPLLGP